MASVHSLEEANVARLRAQLGAATEERDHLLAFARGHSGAVSSIHRAVLALFDGADGSIIETVIGEWPAILGLDSVAVVLVGKEDALLATSTGVSPLDRAIARRAMGSSPLTMRSVDRGHPLFGPDSADIRAEALIRFDCRDGERSGVLLLGQKAPLPVDPRRGGELLQFLGGSLGAMIGRWKSTASD